MKIIIDKFIKYLLIEKRYSDKTVDNYTIDLYLFLDFLGKNDIRKFSNVSYDLLRKYLEFLCDKNYSNKTISRHISSLKSFYKYLINNNIIESNPTELLSLPKAEFRLPNYLTTIELDQILNIPNKNTIIGRRDLLILEMFYSTGIRLSELVNIKVNDIDKNNRLINIFGKGNKERYVFFSRECLGYLKEYLENSRPLLNKRNSDYLFLNKNGEVLTPSGVQYIVKKILNSSGLSVKLTPHVLRHTFATHMLNEGANLMTVKELLGHSNISTTGIYTHVSNESLRKTYLSSHPRARKED